MHGSATIYAVYEFMQWYVYLSLQSVYLCMFLLANVTNLTFPIPIDDIPAG